MPSRYSRLAELHVHRARSTAGRPPDYFKARRDHPDWPSCPCGWPLDPAAGGTTHPGCEARHG